MIGRMDAYYTRNEGAEVLEEDEDDEDMANVRGLVVSRWRPDNHRG